MKKLLLKISILLFCIQLPIAAQFSASIQKGCDSLTVKFNYNGSVTNPNTKWYFGDGTISNENNPQHKFKTAGLFTISLVVNEADSFSKEDYIQIGKTPSTDFQYHDTLEIGSHKLAFVNKLETAPFPYQYQWKISDGGSGTLPNLMHQFDTVGIYSVKLVISDILGCKDSTTKAVQVLDKLNVPNVFTPNNDNINDLFIVNGNGETTYSLKIFSRTGMKIYETSAQVLVWDGRMFSGEMARDGIYYYVIDSVNATVSLKQTGFFYIFSKAAEVIKK